MGAANITLPVQIAEMGKIDLPSGQKNHQKVAMEGIGAEFVI